MEIGNFNTLTQSGTSIRNDNQFNRGNNFEINEITPVKESGTDLMAANKKINDKEMKDAVEKLNTFLEDQGTHAVYEIHDKLKDVMIKIIDNKSGDVITEVPPKKILDMVAKMCEMVGILVDEKA